MTLDTPIVNVVFHGQQIASGHQVIRHFLAILFHFIAVLLHFLVVFILFLLACLFRNNIRNSVGRLGKTPGFKIAPLAGTLEWCPIFELLGGCL